MLPCMGFRRSGSRIRQGSVKCGGYTESPIPASFGPAGPECLRGGCNCAAGYPNDRKPHTRTEYVALGVL